MLFFIRIVGEGERRAGVIQRVLILDANGNRNRFDFSEQRFNRDVPEDRFQFAAPPRTRRVQP